MPERLALDRLAAGGEGDDVAHDLLDAVQPALARELDAVGDAGLIHPLARADEAEHPFQHALRAGDVPFLPRDADVRPLDGGEHVQLAGDDIQIFIQCAEQLLEGVQIARFDDRFCLHSFDSFLLSLLLPRVQPEPPRLTATRTRTTRDTAQT